MKDLNFKLSFSIILLCVLVFSSCNGQKSEATQDTRSRQEKWLEDLDYFENTYLTESKTFSPDSLPACKNRIAYLRANIDSLNDNQIILELSRCVAMADNGHTTIHLSWMDKIPVRFYDFDEGLYIIKTDSANSQYLGSRVLKINSLTVAEIQEKLNPYLAGIDSWKKYTAVNYLCSPQILNGIGLSREDSITLTLLDGEDTLNAEFGIKEMKGSKYEYLTWSDLQPDVSETEWVHFLDPDHTLPMYLNYMNEGVHYEFIQDEKIAYFSINALWYRADDFKESVKVFIDSLKMHTDYDVVIDLRYYTGGNYMIPLKLATQPPKIIDDQSKIYLITSNMTFSAGLVTAARVKYYAGDKIFILGEKVGDNLVFWAEGDYYRLPNANIRIQDSKAQHDWKDDKFVLFKTFFFNLFLGVPAKSLEVNKEMKLSFDDYQSYKDPMMDWIQKQ